MLLIMVLFMMLLGGVMMVLLSSSMVRVFAVLIPSDEGIISMGLHHRLSGLSMRLLGVILLGGHIRLI